MKSIAIPGTFLFLALSTSLYAQLEPTRAPEGSRQLIDIIMEVAEDMGIETIIDPRVRGIDVYAMEEDIDFENLQGILRVHSFYAFETAEQMLIIPDENARSGPTRILQEDDPRVSDHEIVTRIIEIPEFPDTRTPQQVSAQIETDPFRTSGPNSAVQLVPVLRPMMDQSAHLTAVSGTNKLILVDRYDNVRRITAVIEELVRGFDD